MTTAHIWSIWSPTLRSARPVVIFPATEYHVSLAGIKLHGLATQALVWTTGHNTSMARCSGGTECTIADELGTRRVQVYPPPYCGNGLWVVITEILLETFHVHCTIPHCSACFGWENVFIEGCSLWLYFTVLQATRSIYRARKGVRKSIQPVKSFRVAAPFVWNNLPRHLRNDDISREQFGRDLKTFLFARTYSSEAPLRTSV